MENEYPPGGKYADEFFDIAFGVERFHVLQRDFGIDEVQRAVSKHLEIRGGIELIRAVLRGAIILFCEEDHRAGGVYAGHAFKVGDQRLGKASYAAAEIKRASPARLEAERCKMSKELRHFPPAGLKKLVCIRASRSRVFVVENRPEGFPFSQPVPVQDSLVQIHGFTIRRYMKIAIIVRRLNVQGGIQRHVLCLAQQLKQQGHTVKLYTFVLSPEQCYPDLLDGLAVTALGYYPRSLNLVWDLMRERIAAKKLARLIDHDTDVLNPHDQVCYKVAYYFKKTVKNVPSVWTMHDMPTRAFALWQRKELGLELKRETWKKFSARFADAYNGHFIRRQDEIVVLDRADQARVKQAWGREAVIAHNGIELRQFPYRPRSVPAGAKRKLLMAGIFFPHRRFEDGIMAVRRLVEENYDVELSIVGGYETDDPYYRRIAGLCDSPGLRERVRFLGKLPEEHLIRNYHEHDVFIFPSHHQSWGLAVFEAMACGLPVIVSRTAGAHEVLTHRENALLVNPKRPEEIAAAVKYMIDDPEAWRRLSAAGRTFVERNISWEKQGREMSRIFAAALANARRNALHS